MEAVKETKITLIHRLNVKPGVAVVVRNVRYYIYTFGDLEINSSSIISHF
jgi:hypothetical protein